MLANEFNDELIEQVNGGCGKEFTKTDITITEDIKPGVCIFTCPNCGNDYVATRERTDGFCPSCEPKTLKIEIPTGEMSTFLPETPSSPSNLKKKIK